MSREISLEGLTIGNLIRAKDRYGIEDWPISGDDIARLRKEGAVDGAEGA